MTTWQRDFDWMVSDLVHRGVPRDRAEAAVREKLRLPDPAADITEDSLEDDIVDAGDKLVRALGFTIVRLSQKRRSKVTEGVPDRRYYHERRRLVFWWEAKASWGRQSPAQCEFQQICAAVGDPYVLGGLDALTQYLATIGVATFDASGLPQPMNP